MKLEPNTIVRQIAEGQDVIEIANSYPDWLQALVNTDTEALGRVHWADRLARVEEVYRTMQRENLSATEQEALRNAEDELGGIIDDMATAGYLAGFETGVALGRVCVNWQLA